MSSFSAGRSPTCAYSSEGLNDHPLVVVGAGGSLENVEENLLEEHLHTQGKASALQSDEASATAAGGLECQTLSNRIAKCRASKTARGWIRQRWKNVAARCEKTAAVTRDAPQLLAAISDVTADNRSRGRKQSSQEKLSIAALLLFFVINFKKIYFRCLVFISLCKRTVIKT